MTNKVKRFIRKAAYGIANQKALCDVPIQRLRHDDKRCYVLEGHGGKKVGEWPIYGFYKTYFQGDEESAKKAWINWYIDQYEKYKNIPKTEGGMRNGSLDRFLGSEPCESENDSAVQLRHGIEKRVKARLRLADSISENGYVPDTVDPVMGRNGTNDDVILWCGHHRVAVLAALGKKIVPTVFVYSKRF